MHSSLRLEYNYIGDEEESSSGCDTSDSGSSDYYDSSDHDPDDHLD